MVKVKRSKVKSAGCGKKGSIYRNPLHIASAMGPHLLISIILCHWVYSSVPTLVTEDDEFRLLVSRVVRGLDAVP